MATTTDPILGLVLPTAGTAEPVNVTTFLDANFNTIARAIGTKVIKTANTGLASSTAETVLHTLTVPANTAVSTSLYKMMVFGNASSLTATTPTLTFRIRFGGVAGTIMASQVFTASVTQWTLANWKISAEMICVTNGVAGTWIGSMDWTSFLGAASVFNGGVVNKNSTFVQDTTANFDIVLTAQWSASSASNSLGAVGGYAMRLTNA